MNWLICLSLAFLLQTVWSVPPRDGDQYWWTTDTRLVANLADKTWHCEDHYGCSSGQEYCWLTFYTKRGGFQIHAHVNLQGYDRNLNLPFTAPRFNRNNFPSAPRNLALKTNTAQNVNILSLYRYSNNAPISFSKLIRASDNYGDTRFSKLLTKLEKALDDAKPPQFRNRN